MLNVNPRIAACKCPDENCKGTTWSINDGQSRMARHFGREHYRCDRCGSRWAVQVG